MSPKPARERTASEPIGSVLAGRYRVERLLGEGGMGRVYLAEHVHMKKPVALKVLHSEMTAVAEVVARFEREAVAAARIDHPNVAQAMDCGHLEDGSLYFVLEYVDGKSLRALVDQGPLPFARALGIARQIASALVAAHHVGIVHRDLKPDNVMLVAESDGTDRVKVLDFGIAKLTGGDERAPPGKTLTRVGAVMGTAGYMAPEQALGQAVSHHADLYAFGSMLYEMLSGHLPFEADDLAEVLAKQLTEAPPALPRSVPKELSELTSRLLARSPSERPDSAVELSESLEAIARRRAAGVAPTAFMLESPLDAAGPSERMAVARTNAGDSSPGRRFAWAAIGALALAGSTAAFALHGNGSSAAAPSASRAVAAPSSSAPLAVVAPSGSIDAPASAGAAKAPSAVAARGAEPGAPSPTARPPASSSTVVRSTETTTETRNGAVKTKKTRRTRVTETHTVRRTRRHTGPGGIYIPPPSQWFK